MKRALPGIAVLFAWLICGRSPAAEAPSLIGARMQSFVDQQTVSGAVTLVMQRGKVIAQDSVGLADIAGKRPMRPDTTFWIASMTKPITATAVMILQDEGKLSVDDPASKFLPEFKTVTIAAGGSPARSVTIRDLLTHTSGVANAPAESVGPNPTLADFAAAIGKQPLQFEPGTNWKYGSGLTVAGRIVEIVSGKPFDAFLDERIFQPLAMKDTTFYPNAEQRARLATIYRANKESQQLEATTATFINANADQPRRPPNPSGGLCSTSGDYARFLQMVLNGGELEGRRILSSAAVRQMSSIHTGELRPENRPGMGWGLGWAVVREPAGTASKLSPGAFGHGGAFGTQAWIDPSRQAVLVLMIARSDLPNTAESNVRAAFQAVAAEQLK